MHQNLMLPNALVPAFRWHTMDGRILTIDEMHTGHIFNAMKMIYNHLAAVSRDCEPIWFNHKYRDYDYRAKTETLELVRQVVFFLWHIEDRGDLPEKYREPYKAIWSQILGTRKLETFAANLIEEPKDGTSDS